MVLGVCTLIGIGVFGVMIYSIINHRKARGVTPARFSHSTKAEVIWTVIPVLVLIAMAIPTAKTLVLIEDTRDSELTVKITGYQWMWHYEYLGEGVSFYSSLAASSRAASQLGSGIDPYAVDHYLLEVDHPLVVPAGTKVRYLITSNDVLHAWWVPEFAVKRDAIPGFINEGWFQVAEPGMYRGQCAELCGKDHGFMPVVVKVLPKAEFAAWLAARKRAAGITKAGYQG
jgi:cytochrome c oxidase subunit 2